MPRKPAKIKGIYEKNPGSGIWYVLYWHEGKRVRKKIGTRAAAVNYLNKLTTVKATDSGIVPTTATRAVKTFVELESTTAATTVSELCADWLRHVQSLPNDYKDQRNPPHRVRLIPARFGELPAASLRPVDIRDWLDTFTDWAPATRNKLKATISAIYRYGKERDKVSINPARDVKRDRVSNGVIRFLTPDEEKRLRAALWADVEAAQNRPQYKKRMLHRIYELDISLKTGMRKSEQYGLRWPDVDFGLKRIVVRDTKNGETRYVPMIADVVKAFKEIRNLKLNRKARAEGRPNEAPDDVVFSIGDNKKWWTEALKKGEDQKL